MTSVYGENANAVDAVLGLVTEHLVPESREPAYVTAVPCERPRAGTVAASARLRDASRGRGGALSYGEDLVASWSLERDRVAVTMFPFASSGGRCRRVVRHDVVFADVEVVGCDASVAHGGEDVLLGVIKSE